MKTEIWHNPRCSKSRKTLALLQEHGIEAEVVRYLDEPPGVERLAGVLEMLEMKASELVRRKEAIFKEEDLSEASEAELLEAMVEHPRLIERPVVIHDGAARLGRPPENVLELFE